MRYGSKAWEFNDTDFIDVLKNAGIVATSALSVWFADYVGSLELGSGSSIAALFVVSTVYQAIRRWSQNYS